ncbi:MAG: polyphosphate:AMP phosphotransferase [Elusimicrobia bacterium]|nr:polyphosphate:AMP phosphotransferase [Elusimicrobiota bacterium]
MLENVDLNKSVEKKEYKKLMAGLELRLGELQREAKELKVPVIIVFEGWDAAGKGTLINRLILPLDPRGFNVHPMPAPNEEERLRPFLWRYWKKTPADGRIAIFDRSWYRHVIGDGDGGRGKSGVPNPAYNDIKSFERQLADDGCVLVKFFLHISKKEQKKRFKELEENKAMSWRVTEKDWKHHKRYDEFRKLYEEMIEQTDTGHGAWTIVEAENKNFAALKIFEKVIGTLEARLKKAREKKPAAAPAKKVRGPAVLNSSLLDKVDLSRTISEHAYGEKVDKYQARLRDLEYAIYRKRVPAVILYEGWDAAGKGGNIRRLTQNLDPRGYEVVPVAAPNDVEKAHHYLWRFWNGLPKGGHITIFDRTWYGRVLVERVEGFCSEDEWKRAYKEINDFEEHLANFGAVIVKFWLHISREEQLKRFEERQKLEHKRWKITGEDWRNREKWDKYKEAVDEMILRTSTTYAPWTIVEADCKRYARIKALKTVAEAIEKKLK